MFGVFLLCFLIVCYVELCHRHFKQPALGLGTVKFSLNLLVNQVCDHATCT